MPEPETETLAQLFERLTGHTLDELYDMADLNTHPDEELISAWCPVEHNVTTWRRRWVSEADGTSGFREDKCATCGAVIVNGG